MTTTSTSKTGGAPAAGRSVAIVRRPSPRVNEGLVTHIERTTVDSAAAAEQAEGYYQALRNAGWSLEFVAEAPDLPDSVFVEDTVVVVDDLAVICRSGAAQRRAEVDAVREVVVDLGLRVAHIEEPGTLDGGDVLQVGTTVYVGRGGRTNGAGIAQLRALVAPLGRRVVPVPLRGVLHLKSAVTALPDGTFLGLGDVVDPALFPHWRQAPEEAGAHVVVVGPNTVLMASSASRTITWLRDLGFDVIEVEISELEKVEGCVTCLSVLVGPLP